MLRNITVNYFKSCEYPLPSFFNEKLLVGCIGCVNCAVNSLLILSPNGDRLTSILPVDNTAPIQDAIWTPRGNIMYLGKNGREDIIVVLSESARIISIYTQLKSTSGPFCFSNDGIIYIAEIRVGVHQSADDGISWSVGFKTVDDWHCTLFMKVILDSYEYFWTHEYIDGMQRRYCVYTVNRKRPDSNVIFKDIDITTTVGNQSCIADACTLLEDGNMNIFLSVTNKTVLVLTVSCGNLFQLLPPDRMNDKSYKLAVDNKRQLLYEAESYGTVKVFQLKYQTKLLMAT